MASVLVSNTERVVSSNQAARAAFIEDVAKRLAQREMLFIADVKSKQMSGRQGHLYTNVVTGNLRRKWFNQTIRENQSIKAIVWSTTPYAPGLELQEGEQEASPVRIPEHTVREHYRRVVAHGPAKSKRGKRPQAETLVRSHTVRAHWVLSYKRLRIGQAWQADFIPKMREDINAAVAAHFPVG